MYEKLLGLVWVPFLFFLVILQSAGIFRRQINGFIQLIMKVKFTLNGYTIYVFPLMGSINIAVIMMLYTQLTQMHEPEDGDKATYYQQLYRTYRNFLLNFLSVILIFEIFYAGRAYSKYIPVSDKLKKLKDLNRIK